MGRRSLPSAWSRGWQPWCVVACLLAAGGIAVASRAHQVGLARQRAAEARLLQGVPRGHVVTSTGLYTFPDGRPVIEVPDTDTGTSAAAALTSGGWVLYYVTHEIDPPRWHVARRQGAADPERIAWAGSWLADRPYNNVGLSGMATDRTGRFLALSAEGFPQGQAGSVVLDLVRRKAVPLPGVEGLQRAPRDGHFWWEGDGWLWELDAAHQSRRKVGRFPHYPTGPDAVDPWTKWSVDPSGLLVAYRVGRKPGDGRSPTYLWDLASGVERSIRYKGCRREDWFGKYWADTSFYAPVVLDARYLVAVELIKCWTAAAVMDTVTGETAPCEVLGDVLAYEALPARPGSSRPTGIRRSSH